MRYILLLSFFSIFILTSCHTSRKATAHNSHDPKFIDDIYLDRHNKKNHTSEGIDNKGHYAEKKGKGKKGDNSYDTDGGPELSRKTREKYAGILGVRNREITDPALYIFIDEWYGVRYQMGGLDKNGIDCSGFAKKLYEEVFKVDIVHSSSEQYATCQHLKKDGEINQGDLVFFKTKGKRISHVGVYLMNDFFVHASTSQGVVISSLKEEYWQKHYVGAGRIKKG